MHRQFATRPAADRFAAREQRAGHHTKISHCSGGVALNGLRVRYEYWTVSTTRPVGSLPTEGEELDTELRLDADFARPFPF